MQNEKNPASAPSTISGRPTLSYEESIWLAVDRINSRLAGEESIGDAVTALRVLVKGEHDARFLEAWANLPMRKVNGKFHPEKHESVAEFELLMDLLARVGISRKRRVVSHVD